MLGTGQRQVDPCSSLTSQPSWIGELQVRWKTAGLPPPPPKKSKQIWRVIKKRHSILASGSQRHPYSGHVGTHPHYQAHIPPKHPPQIHATVYVHMHASIHSQKWVGKIKSSRFLACCITSCEFTHATALLCPENSLLVVIHHPAFCKGLWASEGQIWYRCLL